ncbi:hypothetical protein BDR26DRAFT_857347 [Obelidium mucronatum]|nr:hypothetical protein BDR26DRAFT_857347 [Obelidium mucronatum]
MQLFKLLVTVAATVATSTITEPNEAPESILDAGRAQFEYGSTLLRSLLPIQQINGDDDDDAASIAGVGLRLLHQILPDQLVSLIPLQLPDEHHPLKPSASNIQKEIEEHLQVLAQHPAVASFAVDSKAGAVAKRQAAVAVLEEAANFHSNPDAQMLLGDMFLHSRMLHKRDVHRALPYYQSLATTHGNATAQRILGLMHATGVGVKRDYAKALLYLSFAALGNDMLAHQTLGYWHSVGIATPKSCEDAVWHYQTVADQTIEKFKSGPPGGLTLPRSKIRLPESEGGIYGQGASGAGAPSKNLPQTAESQKNVRDIFEISAQEGDHAVQLELGSIYYTGTRHTKQNHKKALKYFLSAAKSFVGKKPQGEMSSALKHRVSIASMAAGYLGTMYWRGEGVLNGKPDEVTARQWFERGEELGNGMSLNGLGMMALQGAAGFEVNTQKALQYFTDAIQKDYADAYVNLAELTLQTGNPDALASALKFYNAAAQKPPASPLTLYRLAEFHSKGLGGTPKNCQVALGFYKSLIEKADWHDHEDTLTRAFEHYERDTPQDLDSALLLYMFAAERGVEVAQTNAAWLIDNGFAGVPVQTEEEEAPAEPAPEASSEKNDPVVGGELSIHANDMYEVALVLWNRAANQGNVDARVKMGDYHYYGLGLKAFEGLSEDNEGGTGVDGDSTKQQQQQKPKLAFPHLSKHDAFLSEPRFDKAALYYQVRSGLNPVPLLNGISDGCTENGIGVAKAVNLALTQLGIKMGISKAIATMKQFFSYETYRSLLKKYQLIEEIEEFEAHPEGPDQHVKGAIPASVDHHLESVGGGGGGKTVGSAATGGVKDDGFLMNGIYGDAAIVTVLCVVIAGLFLWRRFMPVPVVHVQQTQVQEPVVVVQPDQESGVAKSTGSEGGNRSRGPSPVRSGGSGSGSSSRAVDTPAADVQ